MSGMTMRDRILALVKGEPLDRVPFVMYEGLLPVDQVWSHVGRERVGILRWSRVHRIEHPHCSFEEHDYWLDKTKWRRTVLHTPAGDLVEERAFESAYDSSSIRKHYVEEVADYERFWAYLEDCVVLDDYDRYQRDVSELGDCGTPLVAVERTPYQQLWVQWVGLDNLGYHLADCPDRVQHTVDLLTLQARRTFELAYHSDAAFIDFPDNITAPAIGPKRFRQYCVPLYNELGDMLDERGAIVFVHMDGDLKPLWDDIAGSKVRGIDSLAPTPDNDTSVSQAAGMWPEKRLFVNFPSSVHLRPPDAVREEAWRMLEAAGHTGRLQIQLSENVPHEVWRTSVPAIIDAIEAFGAP